MLDVRPIWEREKAHVVGSIHVPLFIEDVDTSALTLLKKWIQMGYGGMWMGQRLTVKNTDFVDQVEDRLPSKEQRLMVVCGEGLRYDFEFSNSISTIHSLNLIWFNSHESYLFQLNLFLIVKSLNCGVEEGLFELFEIMSHVV